MGFVKLDTGILRSTIWFDKDARDVFLTALLMAEPREFAEPIPQIEVQSLKATGWVAPAGWYGFVPAASVGIISVAGISNEAGWAALERLGRCEADSRSQAFDGRRLIRIDGGYLVLNFMRYREKDHTAFLRMRKLRARKRDAVTAASDAVTKANVTDGREQSTESRGIERKTDSVAVAPVKPSIQAPSRSLPPFRGESNPSVRANPLMGDRTKWERECLELVAKMAKLTGQDPVEVMAIASDYKGAQTTKLNPASMSDDRLMHAVRDLRADIAAEEKKRGTPKHT